jgi:hypothetical protein
MESEPRSNGKVAYRLHHLTDKSRVEDELKKRLPEVKKTYWQNFHQIIHSVTTLENAKVKLERVIC